MKVAETDPKIHRRLSKLPSGSQASLRCDNCIPQFKEEFQDNRPGASEKFLKNPEKYICYKGKNKHGQV